RAALRGRRQLDAIAAEVETAVANQRALALTTPAGARLFTRFLAGKAQEIREVLADATTDDASRAALLQSLGERYADRDNPPKPRIHLVDNYTCAPDPEVRRQNQIDAFVHVFGREPVSPTDWTTAAALDPSTYDSMFQGVDSEVTVAMIRPVPGQGVVRASHWIPQRDVIGFPPNKRDLGNNRRADPHFDPVDTKVTTYIDYENGIVVLRQNPSVEQHPDGSSGAVRVGVPHGSVAQADDGSVRIRYDAGNPFAWTELRDPNGLFRDHAWTVNGDLVFTPGQSGVQVDGTRTNYPSLEVYQDLPNGRTHTVLLDPARAGHSWGPLLHLPRHHEIGLGGAAFEPFDRGGFNPIFDVPAPVPATDFEPVTTTPSPLSPVVGYGRVPA
ncbi:MAG TPA: DUF4226 domain-containing protein, partial [Mycobacterium sp.]|nr:DUF4226 domain-containing protein [Mycobacterium sp.]